MKKLFLLVVFACMGSMAVHAQNAESATNNTKQKFSLKPDSATLSLSLKERFFYGYNFDIYYHDDTRSSQKTNGWSVSVTPEFGYKLNQRTQVGLRLGGSYSSIRTDYLLTNLEGKDEVRNLLVRAGSWEVTPYGRYRLKTLFNDKVGIWLEMHLYTGMEYPRVVDGDIKGTDYEGLRHSITYGAQVSPVITYQFNQKSTFQVFFSILSFGYSGTTFCYMNDERGRYKEYSNDVIVFSGKLRNLLANQFTPGLYGLKFGVQKKF